MATTNPTVKAFTKIDLWWVLTIVNASVGSFHYFLCLAKYRLSKAKVYFNNYLQLKITCTLIYNIKLLSETTFFLDVLPANQKQVFYVV